MITVFKRLVEKLRVCSFCGSVVFSNYSERHAQTHLESAPNGVIHITDLSEFLN
jgi:hypothetical protein